MPVAPSCWVCLNLELKRKRRGEGEKERPLTLTHSLSLFSLFFSFSLHFILFKFDTLLFLQRTRPFGCTAQRKKKLYELYISLKLSLSPSICLSYVSLLHCLLLLQNLAPFLLHSHSLQVLPLSFGFLLFIERKEILGLIFLSIRRTGLCLVWSGFCGKTL